MLVLSRKIGEKIVIPQLGIEVIVIDADRQKVRLAFSAPDAIDIYRAEVWRKIVEETLVPPLDGLCGNGDPSCRQNLPT